MFLLHYLLFLGCNSHFVFFSPLLLGFNCSMWLVVAGLMYDNYFLRCLETLPIGYGREITTLCALLYITRSMSV